MDNDKNATADTIEKLAYDYNLHELNQFAQGLSPSEIQLYKTELTDAYLHIFSVWHYDWVCDKIETDPADPESFVRDFMLGLVDDAERIIPDLTLYAERADCYRLLADLPGTPGKKLDWLQQAIATYETALEKTDSIELNAALAHTLLDRMLLTGQFDAPMFGEVLRLYRLTLVNYSESAFSAFLYAGFRLLEFPFAENQQWHHRFMDELAATAARFARHEPFVYLVWADKLTRMLNYEENGISPEYAGQLREQTTELLAFVQDYQTENTEKLNRLGDCFEKSAKRMTDVAAKLAHYETALKYFTQGQSVNPAAWTFPVYATNVLMAMAKIYHAQRNTGKVIEAFETGRELFAKNLYPDDFQLVIYWGDFLIEYARLAHNFQAPEILREAEAKLLIAKEQGRQFYSHPYLSLAKVALKLGDKAKCLSVLQECQALFGKYYDRHMALEDEDFREIWPELG